MRVPELAGIMNMTSVAEETLRTVRDTLMLCACAFTSAVVPILNADSVGIDLA